MCTHPIWVWIKVKVFTVYALRQGYTLSACICWVLSHGNAGGCLFITCGIASCASWVISPLLCRSSSAVELLPPAAPWSLWPWLT